MCMYCKEFGTEPICDNIVTDYFDQELYIKLVGRTLHIEAYLEFRDYVLTHNLKIQYCPMCGRDLKS